MKSPEMTKALPMAGQAGEATSLSSRPTLVRHLALDRLSGLYAWGALIVAFAALIPETFLTTSTARSIGATSAVTLIAALALIVPLACGLFDLSVAATLGLASVMVLQMQSDGHGIALSIGAAVLTGSLVGAVNGLLIVKVGVSSFIATLGMSSVLAGAAFWVTDGIQVVGDATGGFVRIGQSAPLGVPFPMWCALGVGVALLYVMECTTLGRYLHAIGGNIDAARLVGIRVDRIQLGSLVTSGVLAAIAGTVLSSQLGSSSADIGPAYLLPAFSAVLLGATQISSKGRVNVGGTIVAVVLLATGIYGLQLAGAPSFISSLFNGAALIVAVSLSLRARRSA
jgi:ribose transport system permease protein